MSAFVPLREERVLDLTDPPPLGDIPKLLDAVAKVDVDKIVIDPELYERIGRHLRGLDTHGLWPLPWEKWPTLFGRRVIVRDPQSSPTRAR